MIVVERASVLDPSVVAAKYLKPLVAVSKLGTAGPNTCCSPLSYFSKLAILSHVGYIVMNLWQSDFSSGMCGGLLQRIGSGIESDAWL